MKKIFIITFLALSSSATYAQFVVDSLGRVNINNPQSKSAIVNIEGNGNNIRSVRNGTLYNGSNPVLEGINQASGTELAIGVRGVSYATNGATNSGVYGLVTEGGAYKNFGVMGCLYSTSTKGAGIFGVSNWYNLTIPSFSSNYAGYFIGNVHIQGNVTYSGSLTGNVILTSAPQPSALQTESVNSTGIRGLQTSNLLQTLDLHTYIQIPQEDHIRQPSPKADHLGLDSTEIAFLKSIEDEEEQVDVIQEQVLSKQHYGLDAEQLEAIFPDLVYDNEDGTKSINYVEMVPILVQAIGELSAKVEALESSKDVKKSKKATGVGETLESMQVMSLGQNKPNPFSTTTEVEVSVPESVKHAFVYVYDLNGKKVQQVDVTARGKQTVSINAATLEEGMYLYSLIADGQVVQTRRMIIEK